MKWTRSAFIAVFQLFVCAIAFPATVTKLDDGVFSVLRRPAASQRVVLSLPLYAHSTARLTLEEFQLWAPDGKVLIHDGNKVTAQDPPPMRFFRGAVDGDPESFAYFSVDLKTGRVTGMVATHEARYAVDGFRRVAAHLRAQDGDDFDYMLSEAEPGEMRDTTDLTWQCGVEGRTIIPRAAFKNIAQPLGANGQPIAPAAITGTQSYSIRLEVETDFELYTNGGSSALAVTNYITNLTGAVSTIYNRDLKTNVVLQNIHVYTTAADPWSQTINDGLYELGDYYHANYLALKRSAVVMISGKNVLGGVAWEGVIGFGDFDVGGHFGGSYAWCGGIGIGGFGAIPDPNATVGTVQYGMPSGTQNYWPLAEYAHELGHVMGGHHTHCVAITDAERIASGFTDGSPATAASNFVDHCYGNEGQQGCYAGTSYASGSETVFNGTIMSYCHNVFGAGGVPQSRFVFGPASEPSHHELDDYMMRALGPTDDGPLGPLSDGGPANIVTATTATMSAITAPASVNANATGNIASVTNVAGQTYAWTITGGTITAGVTTNSATFTAGASGNVVLRVAAYGSNNCGVTDTVTIPIITGPPPPAVTSLTVTSGPTFGGTATVITGTGFVNGATVKFGGTAADVVFVNSTTLNIITPQRATAGAVDVVVTNPDLQTGTKTNGYTYTLTAATTLTVVPNVGPTAGGTAVTITGTLYFGTVTVTFGGTAATNVIRVNPTTITCTTAGHAAGAVNVVVTNGDGGTSTATNGFTYQSAPPTIGSLDVTHGPMTGGTAVTITGTNFVAPATVDFGGAAATNVNVASPTSITLTTPAHAVGLVDVTVTTGGQPVTKTGAFTFDVVALPDGDANGNGTVDAGDIVYLANFLFAGGPAPVGNSDVNADTFVNVVDLFYLVNYVFGDGAAPL